MANRSWSPSFASNSGFAATSKHGFLLVSLATNLERVPSHQLTWKCKKALSKRKVVFLQGLCTSMESLVGGYLPQTKPVRQAWWWRTAAGPLARASTTRPLNQETEPTLVTSQTKATACGYGLKLNHQGTAGFGPCVHLQGFHFGYIFLTHSHVKLFLFLHVLKGPIIFRVENLN